MEDAFHYIFSFFLLNLLSSVLDQSKLKNDKQSWSEKC